MTAATQDKNSLYRSVTVHGDTLTRIWREQQRVIVYRGAMAIQRGDVLRLTSAQPDAMFQDQPSILVLVSFVTTQNQPAGQLVVGFETVAHWTDDQLHSLDACGWEGRAGMHVGKMARTRPHPQQDEINRLVKLIKENSINNATLAMQERAWEFKKQLHDIAPDHPLVKGGEWKA